MEISEALSPIQRACATFGWGGQSKLARALSEAGAPCTPQAVQKMCSTGHVPAERVLAIEAATGISRHELRPDLYPEIDASIEPTEQAIA
ncbi:helix-turn-helix domain-containing protein [Burkholderia contaminans]|uniref:transcriptional regulator n=1 Tax=Burkholderia contaminans TaxID=488447 RepID=UPI00214F8726|nr:helix-turn-helix domain-containing protein [Burkholderia contaminans]UUX38862.1 helix-turn-helix domain-containing protein [Burkholderia contaminans]